MEVGGVRRTRSVIGRRRWRTSIRGRWEGSDRLHPLLLPIQYSNPFNKSPFHSYSHLLCFEPLGSFALDYNITKFYFAVVDCKWYNLMIHFHDQG
ncbi:hypothetical protein L1887_11477 [Cichorium endivia]|nr:hypothetical protein L1887_11477 [Cichorium endivia]